MRMKIRFENVPRHRSSEIATELKFSPVEQNLICPQSAQKSHGTSLEFLVLIHNGIHLHTLQLHHSPPTSR